MENFEACYHKTQDSFFKCTELCSDFDHWCQQNCTAKYIAQLEQCPCMAECPGEFLNITAHIHYRGVGIPRTGIPRTPLEFPGQAFAC